MAQFMEAISRDKEKQRPSIFTQTLRPAIPGKLQHPSVVFFSVLPFSHANNLLTINEMIHEGEEGVASLRDLSHVGCLILIGLWIPR